MPPCALGRALEPGILGQCLNENSGFISITLGWTQHKGSWDGEWR